MGKKEKIPCRICGKLFEPCAYCQEHSDVFRWRNFACSKECAIKYINETNTYRKSLKNNDNSVIDRIDIDKKNANTFDKKVARKKSTRKSEEERKSVIVVEN